MISTRFTSDVWKAYLFAADVIAAKYSEYLHRRKATAACMGPANTASPGTIEYDSQTTTVRARMGAHRTSVVVFAPCTYTSRYWYARRFGSPIDINGTTGRTPKAPGSRPPGIAFVRVRRTRRKTRIDLECPPIT